MCRVAAHVASSPGRRSRLVDACNLVFARSPGKQTTLGLGVKAPQGLHSIGAGSSWTACSDGQVAAGKQQVPILSP